MVHLLSRHGSGGTVEPWNRIVHCAFRAVMQHLFDCLSERIEWLLSTWWGVSAYLVGCVASYAVAGWDGLDRWVYLSGAALLVVLIGSGRRDSKAMHAKLDDIDDRDDLNRLEERSESEIEAKREP